MAFVGCWYTKWSSVANGFRYRRWGEDTEIAWTTVALIREIILYERPPILKGPASLLLPKIASKSYLVTTSDGQKFCFDGNSVAKIKRLGEMLHERAMALELPWETVRSAT